MNPHHARIAAGLESVSANLAVVLLGNPPARREVGRCEQLDQIAPDIVGVGPLGHRLDAGPIRVFVLRDIGTVVFRRIRGEGAKRDIAYDFAAEFEHHVPCIGHFPDDGEIQFPLLENGRSHFFLAGLQHHEHALLAFAQHHFIGRHALFAARNLVHVEPDAGLAIGRHLHAGRGQTRGAHVLNGDDGVGGHQLQAGFDQQLLGEGIADLHGRALGLRVLFEIRGSHGRAVNAVTPGLGADIDDRIADAGRGAVENLVRIGDAHRHRIDQDIAVIGRVEVGFAGNGRNTDAIAVPADPRDHALDQVLHLGVIRTPEAQCIGIRHRASAHGEHVAQDAADTGRRALIGFDVTGVVVAFHLEDGGLPVADIDHAGIFARTADNPRSLGRQLLQMQPAALVGTMFRPHDREDAQFHEIGLPAQGVQNAFVFFGAEAVLFDDFGGDRGFDVCHARALSAARPTLPVPRDFYAILSTAPRRRGRSECRRKAGRSHISPCQLPAAAGRTS